MRAAASFTVHGLIFASLGALIALSGCAAQGGGEKKSIKEAADTFSKIVSSSADIVREEARAKVAIRRDEAIVFYLTRGDDPTNITRGGEVRSFANYVCAGTGALQTQSAALDFASTYAKSVNALATPAGDTFAEQWARYLELRGPAPSLKEPEVGRSASQRFSECTAEVSQLLPPKGVAATDVSDEAAVAGVLAAVEAAKELVTALKTLATRGLKAANEAQARDRVRNFVNANDERVAALLGTDLRPEVLRDAWQRRKARSLVRPYYSFAQMIGEAKPSVMPGAVLERSAVVHAQLQEFDALRSTSSPEKVILGIAQAQKALKDAVNSPDAQSSLDVFLSALLSDLDGLKKDYDDLAKKAEAASKAIRDI